MPYVDAVPQAQGNQAALGLPRVKGRGTGEGRRAVIEGNPGVLSAEAIASRLAALEKLKQHPRDAEENRVLLARAERLYETLLAERRQVVAEATSQFERALETQDPRTVRAAQSEFSQFLDSIEGESFL